MSALDLFGGDSDRPDGAPHDPLDRYYTPIPLADAIVDRLLRVGGLIGRTVVEPSAGGGSFVRALRDVGARVYAIDADPAAEGLALAHGSRVGDWLDPLPSDWPEPDAVIGNPPFGGPPDYLGLRHARVALDRARVVVLILPWSWRGLPSTDRVLACPRQPDEIWPIYPRPWGASMRETAVWVWDGSRCGRTVIGDPVVWR